MAMAAETAAPLPPQLFPADAQFEPLAEELLLLLLFDELPQSEELGGGCTPQPELEASEESSPPPMRPMVVWDTCEEEGQANL